MSYELQAEPEIYYSELKEAAGNLLHSKDALAGATEMDEDHHYKPIALMLSSKNVMEDQLTYDIILLRNLFHQDANLGAYQEQAARLAVSQGVELDFFYERCQSVT